MVTREARERAARLFFDRWFEQLESMYTARRARTLGACAAVDEVVTLAESWLRSGGMTRPAIDPEEGGHGVVMLPDVAAETERILRADVYLERAHPARRDVLSEAVGRVKSEKPDDSRVRDVAGQLRVLIEPVSRTYVHGAFSCALEMIDQHPSAANDLVNVCENIVSHLRWIGWTDVALREVGGEIELRLGRSPNGVVALRDALTGPPSDFTCYVVVTLPQPRPPTNDDDSTFALVESLPSLPHRGRPIKSGPYARVVVTGLDPTAAAVLAHRRVLATMGALSVTLPASRIDVASEVVGVVVGDQLRGCETQERLVEEKRTARREELIHILSSSWRASSTPAANPLHDAIRLRHRALVGASDPESRLLLLWSAIERLTAGARGFKAALGAAKELVSHAVTFGKLRREIDDLATAMDLLAAKDERTRADLRRVVGGHWAEAGTHGADRIDREKLLDHLLADELGLRAMVAPFYEKEPLVVQRCRKLWQDLGSGASRGRGKKIAEYHERSRQRVSWQVGRIYRARNRIAHVGVGPERVRDLVGHAHFYLTQLIAICVHYGGRTEAVAQTVLTRRMGQYSAFIQLLNREDEACLTAKALLRPSGAVDGS